MSSNRQQRVMVQPIVSGITATSIMTDKLAQNVIFKNLQQVCSTFTTDFQLSQGL